MASLLRSPAFGAAASSSAGSSSSFLSLTPAPVLVRYRSKARTKRSVPFKVVNPSKLANDKRSIPVQLIQDHEKLGDVGSIVAVNKTHAMETLYRSNIAAPIVRGTSGHPLLPAPQALPIQTALYSDPSIASLLEREFPALEMARAGECEVLRRGLPSGFQVKERLRKREVKAEVTRWLARERGIVIESEEDWESEEVRQYMKEREAEMDRKKIEVALKKGGKGPTSEEQQAREERKAIYEARVQERVMVLRDLHGVLEA